MDSFDFPHVFNVSGRLIEPTQIVCNQVHVLTPLAPDQHNSIVISVFGERPHRFSIAFGARVHKHIEFPTFLIFCPFDLI